MLKMTPTHKILRAIPPLGGHALPGFKDIGKSAFPEVDDHKATMAVSILSSPLIDLGLVEDHGEGSVSLFLTQKGFDEAFSEQEKI